MAKLALVDNVVDSVPFVFDTLRVVELGAGGLARRTLPLLLHLQAHDAHRVIAIRLVG